VIAFVRAGGGAQTTIKTTNIKKNWKVEQGI